MDNIEKLHIGNLIKEKLKEQERSVAWLARQVHYESSNFAKTLKHPSLNSNLLQRISVAMRYNFMIHLLEDTDKQIEENFT